MDTTRHPEPAQVSINRHYAVAPEKVWRAWTDPQALSRWFGPGAASSNATLAEIDLREGGHYRIAFQSPDGEKHEASGIYQEVAPYSRLVFTWGWKSTPERVSRISIVLEPAADGTDLHFLHDRFFDLQARDNHERGWQPFFVNLQDFLQHQ